MGPLPAHPERALRWEGRSAVGPVGARTVPTTVAHTTCIIGTRMAQRQRIIRSRPDSPDPAPSISKTAMTTSILHREASY